MLYRLMILLLIASCATKPTPYQKEKEKRGYNDLTFEDLRVSIFRGNEKTKKDKAQLYAQFRAIENCVTSEGLHANIIDIFDKTVEKQIIRTSGSGWGPSYIGMYPYYSRYSSIGVSAGFNTIYGDSWSELLHYPVIEVYYTCSDRIYRPQIVFRELKADDIKHLVKDVKGAIQVQKVQDNSPNKNSVQPGDIIIKVNGKRIEEVYELIRLFKDKDTELRVQILREGESLTSKLKAIDISDQVIKTEKEIIANVCKNKKKDREIELKTRKLCQ